MCSLTPDFSGGSASVNNGRINTSMVTNPAPQKSVYQSEKRIRFLDLLTLQPFLG